MSAYGYMEIVRELIKLRSDNVQPNCIYLGRKTERDLRAQLNSVNFKPSSPLTGLLNGLAGLPVFIVDAEEHFGVGIKP